LVSILLTLQIVPYFITGFESVPKYAEEANPNLRAKSYMLAIAMTLGIGVSFYALCIAAVSYVAPWQSLQGKRFATAIAFEQALGAHWPVRLILVMAMFGLFQCFNGNFAASTRMLFAFGRNGTVAAGLGRVHERFQTPANAVLAIGAGTLIALFLGDSILVPVTEVGSGSSAFGWFASCASMLLLSSRSSRPSVALARTKANADVAKSQPISAKLRIIAAFGAIAALALVLMKFLPMFPGHFSFAEYVALGVWLLIGFILRRR
jgi:amino acid transporter